MANNENLIPIPGRLHSVATEGHVSGTDEIYDDIREVTQDVLNGAILEEKPYTPTDYSGMGRVVLKKNMVEGVNTLTQDMFYKGEVGSRVPNTNTIYVIQYDFTLTEDITIPANCVLEFDGGSISGAHTLTGIDTGIITNIIKIFSTDIVLAGSWKIDTSYPEWFGAKGDGITDDTLAIQKCLDIAKFRSPGISVYNVKIPNNRVYGITATLSVYPFTSFGGNPISVYDCAPSIKVLNNTEIDNITLSPFITEPSRINIHNLNFEGTRYAITLESSSGLWYSNFENISFGNGLRRGLSFVNSVNKSIRELKIRNIRCTSADNIEIPIYIESPSYVSAIEISDSTFESCTVGAIYINASTGGTGPIQINKCTFDHAGTNYNLDTYNEYGSFAICANLKTGILDVKDCYFESDCPLKHNDEAAITKHGYIEAKSSKGYTYITNPDLSKTAEIVFTGANYDNNSNGKLIVHGCHISVSYQTISLNGGALCFYDNEIYVPGVGTYYTEDEDSPIQDNIVFVKSNNGCADVSLDIKQYFSYNEINALKCIRKSYSLDSNTNSLRITSKIYIPAFNDVSEYSYKDIQFYGENAQIFIDANFLGIGLGTKAAPFTNMRDALLKAANIIKAFNCKSVTFVLLSDLTFDYAYDSMTPYGCKCIFTSIGNKTLVLNPAYILSNNSEIEFRNIQITKGGVTSSIRLYDCNLSFFGCVINVNANNATYGFVNCAEGNCVVSFQGCTITKGTGVTDTKLVKKMSSALRCKVYMNNTTNVDNVPYDSDN